jgi:hypothetical protein
MMDWSKFFFFSWLVSDNEKEQLRRENEALRQELGRLRQIEEDDNGYGEDDHYEDDAYPGEEY